MTKLVDVINGNLVLISRKSTSDTLLNLCEIAEKENQNNWLNALQMDYYYESKIVNKKHSKHRRIVNIISIAFENGIVQHWDLLNKEGNILLFYIFEKIADPQIINDIKNAINYKRTQITFDELDNVFRLLIIVLLISFVLFVIEIIQSISFKLYIFESSYL